MYCLVLPNVVHYYKISNCRLIFYLSKKAGGGGSVDRERERKIDKNSTYMNCHTKKLYNQD